MTDGKLAKVIVFEDAVVRLRFKRLEALANATRRMVALDDPPSKNAKQNESRPPGLTPWW